MKKILIIIIILLVGVITLLTWQLSAERTPLPENVSEENEIAEQVVTQLASRMRLPQNEQPVVALINEAERLSTEQDFFYGARNGDYLIVYAQAKKAIVYRFDEDFIVNAGPTYFQQEVVKDQNEK